MAWNATNLNLSMAEGDYGIALPIEFDLEDITLGAQDSIKIVFKTASNGDEILEKVYDGIVDNTVSMEFTEEESAKFPVDKYVYRIDWYQNGNFMCNLVESAQFKVVDKA